MKKLIERKGWFAWKWRYFKGDTHQKALCHAFEARKHLDKAIAMLSKCECAKCRSIRHGYEITADSLEYLIKKEYLGGGNDND